MEMEKSHYKTNLLCRKFSVRHLPIFLSTGTTNERNKSRRYPTETFGYDTYLITTKTGFTLIELLIVVLIIGILAAVAVPQYQKAVEKARATQAITLLKSIIQAAEEYYLANGTEFTTFDELSLDIPLTNGIRVIGSAQETLSNTQWALELQNTSSLTAVYITRLDGKYKGAGFSVGINRTTTGHDNTSIYCFERTAGSTRIFDSSLAHGAYCVQIIKGTLIGEGDWNRLYKIP